MTTYNINPDYTVKTTAEVANHCYKVATTSEVLDSQKALNFKETVAMYCAERNKGFTADEIKEAFYTDLKRSFVQVVIKDLNTALESCDNLEEQTSIKEALTKLQKAGVVELPSLGYKHNGKAVIPSTFKVSMSIIISAEEKGVSLLNELGLPRAKDEIRDETKEVKSDSAKLAETLNKLERQLFGTESTAALQLSADEYAAAVERLRDLVDGCNLIAAKMHAVKNAA